MYVSMPVQTTVDSCFLQDLNWQQSHCNKQAPEQRQTRCSRLAPKEEAQTENVLLNIWRCFLLRSKAWNWVKVTNTTVDVVGASEAFIAEILLRSPWKQFVFIVKKHKFISWCRKTKVSGSMFNLILKTASLVDTPFYHPTVHKTSGNWLAKAAIQLKQWLSLNIL